MDFPGFACDPGRAKEGGSLKAASKTVTPEQFQTLSRFARRKLTQLGERMLGGEVAPDPYEADGRTPCDYCDYADVCGFDRKIPGSCPHRLEPLGKDEVWMRMERELKQEASDRSRRSTAEGPGTVRGVLERAGGNTEKYAHGRNGQSGRGE